MAILKKAENVELVWVCSKWEGCQLKCPVSPFSRLLEKSWVP